MPSQKSLNEAFSSKNRGKLLMTFRRVYNNSPNTYSVQRNRLLNVVYFGVKMNSCEIGRRKVEHFLKQSRRLEY